LVVLVTSTNHIYARQISLLLEQGDLGGLWRLWRARLAWLSPILIAFLILTLGFPARILALFGASFVAAGSGALGLLAISNAFSLVFALAPTYLKYTRLRGAMFKIMAVALIIQLVLLFLLVPRFGATGAALAHAVATMGFYAAAAWMAWRDLDLRGTIRD
jgi:O-antigen/teichoic acid export membrane protein